ncbi:MAG TPA: hypothetical protein VMP68_32930 [Candidatus Eisenbacteria bacterium]|nr:hypothetical protein [Candidatus Eisenbacteria bacterium]
MIWTSNSAYQRVGYASETDLESAIIEVAPELFGAGRIYLNVKKKIGLKGGLRNVPDGYLLDLAGRKPQLYVVENELASHEPLRHIAVQILEFSLSFETDQRAVKAILFEALQSHPDAKGQSERYAASHGFRNLDHMLEHLVYEAPFAALVIIDELPDNLESVLAKRFQFGVEVLELARFENQRGERLYHFEPFLADLQEQTETNTDATEATPHRRLDVTDLDTVVVPAREDGFREVFLGENRWYAIRIHGTMRPQIKYIAGYQVAPVSAITHIAPVSSIEPWKDTNKFVVNFSEPAREMGPIPLVKGGRVRALQNLRYSMRERLSSAKTLDDIW